MHPFLFAEIPWMRMRRLCGFNVLAIGMAGFLVGCGGGSAVPKLAPVSGTVQIKGEPTSDVMVIFSPTGDTKTTGASGVTGPDGKYQLMHRSGEPGIEPGKYAVTFSRMMTSDGKPVPAGTSPTDVGAVESIPERFRDPATPAHTADVKPEGGTFDFAIDAPAAQQSK
jgi:hypothetical protein